MTTSTFLIQSGLLTYLSGLQFHYWLSHIDPCVTSMKTLNNLFFVISTPCSQFFPVFTITMMLCCTLECYIFGIFFAKVFCHNG